MGDHHQPASVGRRRALLLIGGAAAYPVCRARGGVLACGGRVEPPSKGTSGAPEEAGVVGDAAHGAPDGSGEAAPDASNLLDAVESADVIDAPDAPDAPDAADAADAGDAPDGGDATDGCPPGNVLAVTFGAYPALLQAGGSVLLTEACYSDPICGENGIVVVHTTDGRYLAFSSGCTHACCQVSFTGSELVCVCDGGTFDMTGRVVAGPPKQPLPVLPTTWDENAVYVTF